jgi:small subunit ribosomal protein S9
VSDDVTSDQTFDAAEAVEPAAERPAPAIGDADATAIGRRKEAVARVRLVRGSGEWRINGRSLQEYFPDKVHQQLVNSPFVTTETADRFDIIARINGGGASGQAGALRLAVARALNEVNSEAFRGDLKKAGFLSRDARVKERKKYGLKKARKAPQYSKR